MAFGDTTTLTGASGAQYNFLIFPRDTRFQAKPSVYVMGRNAGGDRYEFCYVGETNDLSQRPLRPDKTQCFSRFGVDHIFLLEEFDAGRRAQVVSDLVRAYAPSCNAL